jgi:predicted RNA-binding Zn-ribbon protein involved in translation (DUF1610 family)
MALFICPACSGHSKITEEDGREVVPHTCPHCGEEFDIDLESNTIINE